MFNFRGMMGRNSSWESEATRSARFVQLNDAHLGCQVAAFGGDGPSLGIPPETGQRNVRKHHQLRDSSQGLDHSTVEDAAPTEVRKLPSKTSFCLSLSLSVSLCTVSPNHSAHARKLGPGSACACHHRKSLAGSLSRFCVLARSGVPVTVISKAHPVEKAQARQTRYFTWQSTR